MDEKREAIEDLRRRRGYEEKEAEVAYHLGRAEKLLDEMYEETFEDGVLPGYEATLFQLVNIAPHFRALVALLDRRVLERDYPKEQGRPPENNEGDRPG